MFTLLAGRIIQVVLMVIQLKLATTLLKPSEYGAWALIQSIGAFFILIGITPFGMYLNRNVIDWQNNGFFQGIFRKFNLYLISFSIASAFISFFLVHFKIFTVFGYSGPSISGMIFLIILTQAFYMTWVSTLNLLGDRKGYVFGSIFGVLINILIATVFYYFKLHSVLWWTVSVSLGFIISSFIVIPKSWYMKPKGSEKLIIKDILSFSLPLLTTTLFTWSLTQGYRWVVEGRIGIDDLGLFVAGMAVVGGVFGSLEMVIYNFALAGFFKRITGNVVYTDELRKVWRISLYPYMTAGVLLYFIASDIALLFLSKQFLGKIDWLSYAVFAEFGRVIFNLIGIHYHGIKNTKKLFLPQLIGFLVAGLMLVMPDELSFNGIILAIGGGYLIATVFMILNDFKTYSDSGILKEIGSASIINLIFFLGCFAISEYSSNLFKFVFLILLFGLFSYPYLNHYIKNRNHL